jgi:hypothetical protein
MTKELSNINWNNTITLNPTHGVNLAGEVPQGGLKIPSYGHFGGPQNPKPGADPQNPIEDGGLDALFMKHDGLIFNAVVNDGVLTPDERISAHSILISDVAKLDAAGGLKDAEATVYAGLTNLALTAEVISFGGLATLEQKLEESFDSLDFSYLATPPVFDDVLNVVNEAVENMETGLDELHGQGKSLHGVLNYFEKQLVTLLTPPDTPDLW